jgi:alpha-glucosidase
MYFGRIPHPDNFSFDAPIEATVSPIGGDAFRLRIASRNAEAWVNPSQAELAAALEGEGTCAAAFDASGSFAVKNTVTGETLLSGLPNATFGVSGTAWMLQFAHTPDMQFYGLGEHCRGFDKTGQRVKFWNTDVWADYPLVEAFEGNPASLYVSIPWAVVKRGNTYLGILVHHPGAVFMDLASNFILDVKNSDDKARGSFYLGAPDGAADVYVLVGPTLAELTRKMQILVGRTPLPPLWALGYHQCRWGYAGPEDLRELDRKFDAYGIPADGLWLDIDYMDRYKVFTFNPTLWGDRETTRETLDALRAKGRRVVPILDPGVKAERGYAACDDGLAKGVFCLNREGKPFTGFVWPGKTYMPDFSLPPVREWWAQNVADFARAGASGAWLDMNDPSVGTVELDDMLFDHGRQPHESYHNQYALGMAKASHAGFLAARPDERPFLLSRSACTSSSRYTAVWTGDNYSNRHHLTLAIPMTLNLALSGIPFNGPDVPGFGGNATPELAVAWYKSGFLFPFLRNHAMNESNPQEPWAFGDETTRILAHYIRLRYKLLPYIYQLWIAQEEHGEAVLRPLFYDFADTSALPLGNLDDQFMVGPDLMQAPILAEGAIGRRVTLPRLENGRKWYCAMDGEWCLSGQVESFDAGDDSTPVFIREGALIPMQAGERTTQKNDLGDIELHCFLCRETKGVCTRSYAFDDGESFDYRKGRRTSADFDAEVSPEGGILTVTVKNLVEGFRTLKLRVVAYDDFREIRIVSGKQTRASKPRPHAWRFSGSELPCYVTPATVLVGTFSAAC